MEGSLFKRYDRQFWILISGALINSFGFSLVYPFISLYLYLHRGIPMTSVGLLLLVSALVGMLFQVIGGELSDRIGRKAVLVSGLIINIIGFGLLTIAILGDAGYFEFLALMCILESAIGFYRSMPGIMIADTVPAGDRNGAFSLLRIGWNLGFALGPLLGGVLAMYSYAILFGMAAVASGVYLMIVFFLIRDTKPKMASAAKDAGYGEVWRDRTFLLFCGIAVLIALVYAQIFSTFSTYSGSYGRISAAEVGLLFSMNGFMIAALQYPIARYLERFRITTSLILGTLFYAVGYGAVGFCAGFWPLAGCMLLITMGEIVYSPSSMNIVSRMAKLEVRGRYMSMADMMVSGGFAFGPAVGGFLMDKYTGSIETMWMMLGGLLIACVFGLLVLRRIVSRQIDGPAEALSDK
jgi:Arabinose efflux permease